MSTARLAAPGSWPADRSRSTVGFSLVRVPSGTLRGHVEDVVARLDVGRAGDLALTGTARTASGVVAGGPAARAASAGVLDARRFPRMATSAAVGVLTLGTLVDRRQFGVDATGAGATGVRHAYETRLQVELVLHRRWEP